MSTNRIGNLFPTSVRGETLFKALPDCLGARERFPAGSRVRIDSGVFQGVEGTILSYCSPSRVSIAVDLNCRGVSIEIDDRMVRMLDG